MEKKHETKVQKRDFSQAPSKEVIAKDMKALMDKSIKYLIELKKKVEENLNGGKITVEQYDGCVYSIITTEDVIRDLIEMFTSFSFETAIQYRNKKCSLETSITALKERLEQKIIKRCNKGNVSDYTV